MSITPTQIGAARRLLGWTHLDLSVMARVAPSLIQNAEAGERETSPRVLEKVRSALEAVGVEFIAENGEGPGVRLRKSAR